MAAVLDALPRADDDDALAQTQTRDGEAAPLAPFACFATERTSYRCRPRGEDDAGDGDECYSVDLDVASFGHAVGEVEALVPQGAPASRAAAAADSVRAFAERLGLGNNKGGPAVIRGKVHEYLRRHRPEHLAALVQAGVFDGEEVEKRAMIWSDF